MHKVVIERPRWNPGPGKGRRRANLPDELKPKFEGIKRPHYCRKGLTDLLGPLKRWLRSQVGRPWNDVYSEACEVIKPDSIIRAHVKTHLLEFVERNTLMKNGGVWCFMHWGQEHEVPIARVRNRCCPFYVHPETGVLCEIPPQRRTKRIQAGVRDLVRLSKTRVLRKLNGLWFECRMEPFPKEFKRGDNPWRWDYAEGKMIGRGHSYGLYSATHYCAAKRQVSSRELKKYGLKNDPAWSGEFVTRVSWVTNSLDGHSERAVDCGFS